MDDRFTSLPYGVVLSIFRFPTNVYWVFAIAFVCHETIAPIAPMFCLVNYILASIYYDDLSIVVYDRMYALFCFLLYRCVLLRNPILVTT